MWTGDHTTPHNQPTMSSKNHLTLTVLRSLTTDPQSIVEVSRSVFNTVGYSPDQDEFYTYQYDLRWSLCQLVKDGIVTRSKSGRNNFYSLSV